MGVQLLCHQVMDCYAYLVVSQFRPAPTLRRAWPYHFFFPPFPDVQSWSTVFSFFGMGVFRSIPSTFPPQQQQTSIYNAIGRARGGGGGNRRTKRPEKDFFDLIECKMPGWLSSHLLRAAINQLWRVFEPDDTWNCFHILHSLSFIVVFPIDRIMSPICSWMWLDVDNTFPRKWNWPDRWRWYNQKKKRTQINNKGDLILRRSASRALAHLSEKVFWCLRPKNLLLHNGPRLLFFIIIIFFLNKTKQLLGAVPTASIGDGRISKSIRRRWWESSQEKAKRRTTTEWVGKLSAARDFSRKGRGLFFFLSSASVCRTLISIRTHTHTHTYIYIYTRPTLFCAPGFLASSRHTELCVEAATTRDCRPRALRSPSRRLHIYFFFSQDSRCNTHTTYTCVCVSIYSLGGPGIDCNVSKCINIIIQMRFDSMTTAASSGERKSRP